MQLFQIKAGILGGIKDGIIIAKNDQIIDRVDQLVRPQDDVWFC
jgi:hypothetical protein